MWGKSEECFFITVCCAERLCPVSIQILPFSLYHLSHTDVRVSMTRRGHFFVVLFYLFLDNEKSAEGLAWAWLSHIFTHETLARPYGSSTGGYLTLMTVATEAQILISLLQRVVRNPHSCASWLKTFFAVTLWEVCHLLESVLFFLFR